jgi:hypothetical protein
MKSYPTHYLRAKKLEGQLLDYLNTYQIFKYYDTCNNVELPMTPYYPSLYRYSPFDIYNEYLTIELKSRSNLFCDLPTNILDTNKVINNHSIFCFTYNNSTEILNDIHYIPYDKSIFDTFYIQHTQNNCKLFVIPKTEPTFKPLNTYTPYTHQININYTDDYKDKHTDIIATDKTKYLSTFGLYAI